MATHPPTNEAKSKFYPLSVILNQHRGRDVLDRDHSWDYLLSDWDDFRTLSRDDAFFSRMSQFQRNSYHVLEAWWSAKYCSPLLPEYAQSYVVQQRGSVYPLNPADPEEIKKLPSYLMKSSLYGAWCFLLLLREFHPGAWNPQQSTECLIPLQRCRYNAASVAVAQKMADTLVNPQRAIRQSPSTYPEVLMNDTLSRASCKDLARPYYLWDSVDRRTVTVHELPALPKYVCISHTWGRWRVKDSAVHIPGVDEWLVPEVEDRSYRVQDLPQQFAQATSRLDIRYIWFDLFCIPQVDDKHKLYRRSQEEINNQAAIFGGSQACVAWINEINSWDDMRYALDYICLEFLQSTSATDDEATIRQMLKLAHNRASGIVGFVRLKPVDEATEANTSRGDDLMQYLSYNSINQADVDPAAMAMIRDIYERYDNPADWLSSLWTLQESVLCPDMQLYNSSWERLDDRGGNPLTLKTIMVFLPASLYCFTSLKIKDMPSSDPQGAWEEMAFENEGKKVDVPRGVYLLRRCVATTRLDLVLTIGLPAIVFASANARKATYSRAPAIMSAIGITAWYKDAMQQQPGSENREIVLNSYPLAFVREAAEKQGALFWESDPLPVTDEAIQNIIKASKTDLDSLGTMLPFTDPARAEGALTNILGSMSYCKIDVEDHFTIREWRVQQNASIHMSSVGIAATSEDSVGGTRKIRARVRCCSAGDDRIEKLLQGVYVMDDIDDFTLLLHVLPGALQQPGDRIYAVVLYHDGPHQNGILLRMISPHIYGERYLVKIGTYWTDEIQEVPATQVDWIVL
jgi:hypothetical protein